MITLTHYLILSTIIFFIGLVGVLKRRNILMLLFSAEILLNGVNIGLAAISKYYDDISGQIFILFIIAIAASEVALGLGFLVIWYKRKKTVEIDSLKMMKG